MERRYKTRWETMLSALNEHLPDFTLQASRGGTCVWLTGGAGIDTTDLAQRLKARGVLVDEGSVFYRDPSKGKDKLRLGFAALSRTAIFEGIKIIAMEVRQGVR
jgi:GntR family transcriptional regulator/MocR family aminotransferase